MFEGLFSFVAYCALMSGTPGPNNVMLATSGTNFGYRRTLPHLLGINAGVFALTLVVCLGLSQVFARFPAIHVALKVAGALYLAFLAWKLVGASVAAGRAAQRPLSFVEGAAFQLVNPKTWMRAATVATVFMPAGMGPLQGALLVSAIGWIVGFPLVSVWTLFGVGIRRFLGTPLRMRVFNVAMAVALLALAVSLVV
ncbi:LysE family translocator [Ramlibacter humi]|uniref:LysE family translocator n=1 Tax=Ramlibacter humi TaxID=2530451 RepID=A0A4Z0BCL5_9BURK|nr:LysE family translocator [Ramlibacter humi]TFY97016.1 LysE family translocator [Ramlibacter humi]